MLTAEERRQRILARSESRLNKIRETNRSDNDAETPPMAPISSDAPVELLQKPENIPDPTPVKRNTPPASSTSIFSMITSATDMMNKFSSSVKSKPIPENTQETILLDKQHLLVAVLGILVSMLYSFYFSSDSNFFFLIYFTCCTCILTSRYYVMRMKHRTNMLITTAMMSGFKPELMKHSLLVYTLVCDAWVIFAFYFVAFSFTYVVRSLCTSE